MSLIPMYDNIVIEPIKVENTSAGGIILTGIELTQQHSEGFVLAVGEGYRTKDGIFPLKVQIGDNVIYRKGVEISIDIDGVEVFLLSEANVLAVKTD